jgi:hypothetical protein
MGAAEQAILAQQLATPHSSRGVFELPCGYLADNGEVWTEVEVSEITGAEEDMLASDEMGGDAKLEALLAGCTRRVGPIVDRGRIAAIIPELTSGDRIFLLFAIRRVTLGHELAVREQCPNKQCNTKTLFTIDLRDLDIKKMPEPTKRIYDVTTPSGKAVRFRVSTGQDEKRMARVMKKERADAISLMMMMRIELIDGKAPDLKTLKTLGMGERQWLRSQFQEVEGGVDTALELECPKCGTEWNSELKATAQSFFSLSGASKR